MLISGKAEELFHLRVAGPFAGPPDGAEAERVRGQGEAESTRIFGEALAKDPEFYRYLRTLQAYRKILDAQTTLILPGDSELMRLLTRGQSGDAAKPPTKP